MAATESGRASSYRILDWDTRFFGFQVAQLTQGDFESIELPELLRQLRDAGVKLVYGAIDSGMPGAAGANDRFVAAGGILVDRRITYRASFSAVSDLGAGDQRVSSYPSSVPEPRLEELAIQAGLYSRFFRDSRIPRERAEELYRQWLRNSLRGPMGDEVLVLRDCGQIAGLITVGSGAGVGKIGLVAVDELYRGKGLGVALVRAAQAWFISHGFLVVQVVTQGDNRQACYLYEKCGYHSDTQENIYHFWLS